MLTIHDRIQSKMADLGLKQADLMRVTGAGRATISSWVNGPSIPRGEYLLKVANVLHTTPEWLLTGSDALQRVLDSAATPMLTTDLTENSHHIWVDVVDVKFSCGNGESIELHFESIKKRLAFEPEFFSKRGVKPHNVKLMYAKGDSMEMYIFDGDIFAIDVSDTEVKEGGVYAVYFEGEAMLKQIFKEAGGVINLHSINSKYRDKVISEQNGASFRVIGRQFWRAG